MQQQEVTPTNETHPRPPLVLYHANCADGFCAALLFHVALPNAELVAVNHYDPPPDVTGREVYILDFSFKRDVLRRVCDLADRVVLLDHHKTAAEELADFHHPNAHITIDQNKSGARLAWDCLSFNQLLPSYFRDEYGPSGVPLLVQFVEDRDLWKWRLPRSHAANAYLRSKPNTFEAWSRMLYWDADDWLAVAEHGDSILRAQQQVIDAHVRFAQEVSLDGFLGRAVNATSLSSEIAGELSKDRDFGACYVARLDGSFVWSLRSQKTGADVSLIAKKFGGGGHQHAAGFKISREELHKVLGLCGFGAASRMAS